VLYAVLRDYVASAQPVGSAQVAGLKGIPFSAATVRHVMAELEEMGFLRRAHASSGRIPTDLAYRYYVDRLLRPEPLTGEEQRQVRKHVGTRPATLEEVIHEACHFVSSRVEQPGVAVAPRAEDRSLKFIQFLRLQEKLAVSTLVFAGGLAETKVVRLDHPMSQRELDRIADYLNEHVSGKTIVQVRTQVLREMKKAQNRYDDLLNRALLLSEQAFSDASPGVHIEGQSFLFSDPEFADLETMQQILRTLEEKTRIVKILDQCLKGPGIRVFIGDELSCPEIQGMSLIASPYSDSEGNRGVLGVLGPTRMNYSRIIPLLEFTSGIVTEVLRRERE
jgi:heat-inducible transcriptional repressor